MYPHSFRSTIFHILCSFLENRNAHNAISHDYKFFACTLMANAQKLSHFVTARFVHFIQLRHATFLLLLFDFSTREFKILIGLLGPTPKSSLVISSKWKYSCFIHVKLCQLTGYLPLDYSC
jgi:hypothetical protein